MSQKAKVPSGSSKKVTNPYLQVVLAAAYGILLDLILLAVFSLLLSTRDISAGLTAPIATFILVAGALLGGYLCGRALRKNGLLNGFLIGGIQFILLLLISLAQPENEIGILALYKFLILAVSAGIGSILGVNRRKKAKTPAMAKRK